MSIGLGWLDEMAFDDMMKKQLISTIKSLPVEKASDAEIEKFYKKQMQLENEKLSHEIDEVLD